MVTETENGCMCRCTGGSVGSGGSRSGGRNRRCELCEAGILTSRICDRFGDLISIQDDGEQGQEEGAAEGEESALQRSVIQQITCSASCSCTVNGVVVPGVVTETENGCSCSCTGGSGGSGSGDQLIRELCEAGILPSRICDRFVGLIEEEGAGEGNLALIEDLLEE